MKRRDTRQRKQALAGLKATAGIDWMLGTLVRVIHSGKQTLDAVMLEMGRMVAESVMLMEREEIAGPEYYPTDPAFRKWAHEQGSIYLGDQAESLHEAFEELLTLHRLKVPALLRKPLMSTNPIESMFSLVRHSERNIKRTRGSQMLQRWLGTVLLACEGRFSRVKGYAEIAQVLAMIESEQTEPQPASTKKAA